MAVVCGIKRTFSDFSPSPVVSKKTRYTKPIKNQHDEALPLKSNSNNGVDWIRDLLLQTLTAVGSMDEAQVCTNNLLEGFERTITAPLHNRISLLEKQADRMIQELGKKNQELEKKNEELEGKNRELERKNQELEHITQENTILKRAVVVQHERLEQCNNKEQEIKHLEDKLTMVQVNNYGLTMHLNQALCNTSIPANSNFHPDVFQGDKF